MKCEAAVKQILEDFKICKSYAGYDYIIDGIHLMELDESSIRHITKTLYVDIAKRHNTTSLCVERNIRKIIEIMWREEAKDIELIMEVFGSEYLNQRPSNTRFFERLYEYVTMEDADTCSTECSESRCRYCMLKSPKISLNL